MRKAKVRSKKSFAAICHKNNATNYDFSTPARQIVERYDKVNPTFRDTTAFVTAPTLTAYVLWVLTEAQRTGLDTLYFLARDGLVMLKIALQLCQAWGLPISCKYLCCSRKTLRLPLFKVDKAYALEKLFLPEYRTTERKILARAGINGGDDTYLSHAEVADLQQKLMDDKDFIAQLEKNSDQAYMSIMGYLKQEISGKFAIVDSGWVGSMQECLTKLLGYSVTGYYFGLFHKKSDGAYHAFLFDSGSSHKYQDQGFSNCLFECLCAADHGMTIGYEQKNEKWVPILAESEQKHLDTSWNAKTQIALCEAYARCFAKCNRPCGDEGLQKFVGPLLLALMKAPTYEQAQVYGAIPFNDGLTVDGVDSTLAYKMTADEVKKLCFTTKIVKILTGKRRKDPPTKPIYWYGGAMTLSGCSRVQRYNINLANKIYQWIENRRF